MNVTTQTKVLHFVDIEQLLFSLNHIHPMPMLFHLQVKHQIILSTLDEKQYHVTFFYLPGSSEFNVIKHFSFIILIGCVAGDLQQFVITFEVIESSNVTETQKVKNEINFFLKKKTHNNSQQNLVSRIILP
jgi:hypothetical protein